MAQIQVRDDRGNGVPLINIRISEGTKPSEEAIFDVFTDLAGNAGWPIPHWPDGAYTLYTNDNNVIGLYDPITTQVTSPSGDIVIRLTPTEDLSEPDEPSADAPTRLHCEGVHFKNAQGKTVVLRGATYFPAYEIWLAYNSAALQDSLRELQDLGCNCVRVFGMSHYIQVNEFGRPAFRPQDYGSQYYNDLAAFCQFIASYGMYVYWSIFPDNGFIMPNEAEQKAHFSRMVDHLSREPNTLLELTNEPNAHGFNNVNIPAFTKPADIPSCSGSYGDEYGGDLPPWPTWDFGDFHTPRSYPKQIIDSCTMTHPIHVRLQKPVICGEPDRYGSQGNPDPRLAAASAGASLATAGWIFHSTNGKRCEPFDAITLPCARAAFGVMYSIE